MKKRIILSALILCALIALCAGASAEGYPESAHPYENNTNQTWTYTGPSSADYLKITFSAESAIQPAAAGFLKGVTGKRQAAKKFSENAVRSSADYGIIGCMILFASSYIALESYKAWKGDSCPC